MGKKKKKKKKELKEVSLEILEEVDNDLNKAHNDIVTEIEELQYRLHVEDQKAIKKMRRRIRKNPDFSMNKERIAVRKKIIAEMESTNLLERIQNLFTRLSPIIAIIGRLVASLITMILSITEVKVWLRPETIKKLEMVYNVAMALG